MKTIITKHAYQSPIVEIQNFDTIDVVRASNAVEISYRAWANGASYDAPFNED